MSRSEMRENSEALTGKSGLKGSGIAVPVGPHAGGTLRNHSFFGKRPVTVHADSNFVRLFVSCHNSGQLNNKTDVLFIRVRHAPGGNDG